MLTPAASLFVFVLAACGSTPPLDTNGLNQAVAERHPAAPFALVRSEGSHAIVAVMPDQVVPESLKSLNADINRVAETFLAEHGLVSAGFYPHTAAGSRLITMQEPNSGRRPDREPWRQGPGDARLLHVWMRTDRSWTRISPIVCEDLIAARGTVFSVKKADGSGALIDVATGIEHAYDRASLGDLQPSGEGTFVSIGLETVLCGTIDEEMRVSSVHTLRRGTQVLIEDIRKEDIRVAWVCNGRYAVIGESWVIDTHTGAVKGDTSDQWEVSGQWMPDRLVLEDYDKPMKYAACEVNCETGEILHGPTFTLETYAWRSIDAERGIGIVRHKGPIQIATGFWEWEAVRTFPEGRLIRVLTEGQFVGFIDP